MLARMGFPIWNILGLKIQVIISYLACVRSRKEPDGEGSACVPDGFRTDVVNTVCMSPGVSVFTLGAGGSQLQEEYK